MNHWQKCLTSRLHFSTNDISTYQNDPPGSEPGHELVDALPVGPALKVDVLDVGVHLQEQGNFNSVTILLVIVGENIVMPYLKVLQTRDTLGRHLCNILNKPEELS